MTEVSPCDNEFSHFYSLFDSQDDRELSASYNAPINVNPVRRGGGGRGSAGKGRGLDA